MTVGYHVTVSWKAPNADVAAARAASLTADQLPGLPKPTSAGMLEGRMTVEFERYEGLEPRA